MESNSEIAERTTISLSRSPAETFSAYNIFCEPLIKMTQPRHEWETLSPKQRSASHF